LSLIQLKDWKKLDIAHQEKLGRREARKKRKDALLKTTTLPEKIRQLEAAKDPLREVGRTPNEKMPPNILADYNLQNSDPRSSEPVKDGDSEELLNLKHARRRWLQWEEQFGTGSLLAGQFDSIEEQHDALNRMKGELLNANAILNDAYPSAAALEKLSPHAQVGYAKEKLRLIKDSWPEQLQYWMQNGVKPVKVNINGIEFEVKPREIFAVSEMPDETDEQKEAKETAWEELFGGKDKTKTTLGDINRLQVVEAVLDIGSEQLFEQLGLDQYSDQMMEISGIDDIMQKTKEAYNTIERQKFIQADSNNIRAKAKLAWNNSNKSSKDLERLMTATRWTQGKDGGFLGNAGGLDFAFSILNEMGVNTKNTGIATTYADLPLSPQLARELGVPYGTTWGEKWPTRFLNLRASIKSGIVKQVNAERDYQKSFGTDLNNKFTSEIRELAVQGLSMSPQRANWYKDQFGKAGLPIPNDILKWEDANDRDVRKQTDLIEALKASQGGVITNQQLDSFNAEAAAPFRKEADSYESGILEDYNVENLIKASLDTTFTGMGLKGNEKNRIYQEAFKNAKIDYIKQFNKLRAMGLPVAHANYLALNGTPGEFKTSEGEPILGFHGVLHEIDTKGEGSKYVITGQNVQDSLGDAFVRVGYVNTAKKQIQKNKNSVTTGLLGGQYGQDQLNIIAANIEKYGLDKGLNMSTDAVDFYRGIAHGTDLQSTGGWMGILDAQLRANIPDHQGLWPSKNDRPNALTLITGVTGDGAAVPDPSGLKALTDQAMRAVANAKTYPEFIYAITLLQDAGYDTSSIFDNPEQLVPYLGE